MVLGLGRRARRVSRHEGVQVKNSPKTTICGLLIALIILVVFVQWHVFGTTGYTAEDATLVIEQIAKILVAILILLLGFFSADEGTH